MCRKREDYQGRCVYVDSRDVCYNVACVTFGALCGEPEVPPPQQPEPLRE